MGRVLPETCLRVPSGPVSLGWSAGGGGAVWPRGPVSALWAPQEGPEPRKSEHRPSQPGSEHLEGTAENRRWMVAICGVDDVGPQFSPLEACGRERLSLAEGVSSFHAVPPRLCDTERLLQSEWL